MIEIEKEQVGILEDEATKEEEKDSLKKEIDEEHIGILEENEIEEEGEESLDEDKKRREQVQVVLDINEKDKKLEVPIVVRLFTLDLVVYDPLKLENQIPFFII